MLSDILLLLFIAYIVLLVIAFTSEIPFVLIVAGIVAFFFAFQAYSETSSAVVGMSLASLGLITLVGGLNELFA